MSVSREESEFVFKQAGLGEEIERHHERLWHLQDAAEGCGDPAWHSQMEGIKVISVFSASPEAAAVLGQRAASHR